jgi:hypothetical protein
MMRAVRMYVTHVDIDDEINSDLVDTTLCGHMDRIHCAV